MARRLPWRWAALLALLALLALSGCHRERYFVVKVDVSTALWPKDAKAGDEGEVRKVLLARLDAVRALRRVEAGQVPKKAPRYALAFTPTLIGNAAEGGEVVATLMLRREQDGLAARYPVEAEAPYAAGGPEQIRRALEDATARVVDSARLQMHALEAKPETLHADLSSKDARVRSFALARLAEAHDPSALPGLRAALKSQDAEEVRRAIGGLVELQDAASVPALIDAVHGRSPEFQREVIYALGEIGGADARGYLYTVSQGADLEPLRAAAQEALHELESRTQPQEKHP